MILLECQDCWFIDEPREFNKTEDNRAQCPKCDSVNIHEILTKDDRVLCPA